MIDRRAAIALVGGAAATAMVTGRMHAAPRTARHDLYNCEGCEAALERPTSGLSSRLQLAAPNEPGERMILSGRAMLPNGRPGAGVIIYAHHTNAQGLYAGGRGGGLWSEVHGRLHGWVLTDQDGRYEIATIRPAPYPDRSMPAHVHLYIAEPGRRPYYIDDVVFAGAFGVTAHYVADQELRGGSGIVPLRRDATGVWLARRDIQLERHPVR